MEDGVVVAEEVDFVDAEGVSAYLLDDVLDDLVSADLGNGDGTLVLLTTLTLRRWLPLPPVLGSPTLLRSFSMLAWISS